MIRTRHYSPEYSVSRALRKYAKVFQSLDGEYMAERANDIFDIEKRLLRNLLGTAPRGAGAGHLAGAGAGPQSDAQRDGQSQSAVRHGLVTEIGGPGSHTAIVAEGLGIPAVVGVGSFLTDVSGGDTVIIDGDQGLDHPPPGRGDARPLSARGRGAAVAGRQAGDAPRSAGRDDRRRADPAAGATSSFPTRWSSARSAAPTASGCTARSFCTWAATTIRPKKRTRRLPRSGRGDAGQAGGDADARPGRRQDADAARSRGRAQSVPGPAQHSAGAQASRPCSACSCGRSCGRAPRQHPHHVSADEHDARAAAGQDVLADAMEDLDEEGVPFDRNMQVGMMVEVPSAVVMMDHFVRGGRTSSASARTT